MKRHILSSLIIITIFITIQNSFSQTDLQWKWLNPLPQGNVIRWVQAISPTHWVGCGGYGTFIRTTNAGITWDVFCNIAGTSSGYEQGKMLWGGWFFNASTGLLCGSEGWIGRTTDGGNTWDSIGSTGAGGNSHNELYFINSTTGFIGGTVIKKTTNAGLNWISLASTGGPARGFFALDENNIFFASYFSSMSKSTNGGINWTAYPTGSGYNFDIIFVDQSTGFISCSGGTVKVTTNGGLNWTAKLLGSTYPINNLYCTRSPFKLYAAGDTGKIFVSTDYGNNWSSISVLAPGQYTANWWTMDISGSTMILAGDYGIFNASTNNGITWAPKNYRIGGGILYDLWHSSTSNKIWTAGAPRWAGFSFDQVLYSSNGGSTFQSQTVAGSRSVYHGIYMLDDNTGYICGEFGAVRKTTNGGNTWDSLITLIPNEMLIKIQFVNASTGWVFSQTINSNGCIWKTTNSGLNWSQQSLSFVSTDQRILTAYMVNTNIGYCTDYLNNNFYKTTNGGTNWNLLKLAPNMFFYAKEIYMANENTGYCCGSGLYRTTNGWNSLDSVVTSLPYVDKMDWTDMQTGFCITGYNLTARTTNGGLTWTDYRTSLEPLSPGQSATKIVCSPSGIAYLTGDGGSIMKLDLNGGSMASVSGTVRYNNDNQPVTSGMVKAVRYDSLQNKIIVIDSAQIQSNGAYIIYNLPPVEMDFMAYEDDELDFVPTYYDTTIYWQHAITLIPTTNLNNIDIKVKRINNLDNGIRHISGTVTTGNDLVGLSNAVVYAKIGSLFKNYDISRANGYFYVDSLQDGSYTLVVDRMGYLPYTINVNLSGSSIENLNINMIYVIGISNINKEIPLQYSLSQNYPNPFNPVTNILFDIIKQENVKLTIYSLLGEEIKVLVNEKLDAGEYKVSFDGSAFASGVYFYKLETENFVESKKMVLLK